MYIYILLCSTSRYVENFSLVQYNMWSGDNRYNVMLIGSAISDQAQPQQCGSQTVIGGGGGGDSPVKDCCLQKKKRKRRLEGSSELMRRLIIRRTSPSSSLSSERTKKVEEKEKYLMEMKEDGKDIVVVPRELKRALVSKNRAQQAQKESLRLTALRIGKLKDYTREEEEEERRRGVSTKLELYSDPWKIKKRLTPSDLGNLSRILIQTHLVDTHVKPSMERAGVFDQVLTSQGLRVSVCDVDTDTVHRLVFKQWNTSRSFILIGSWTPEFVHRRKLKEDDEVGFFWDPNSSRFFFKVLTRSQDPNLLKKHVVAWKKV